jgi:hypothetical protein
MKFFSNGSAPFHLTAILVVSVVCLIIYVFYVSKDIISIERQIQAQQAQLDEQAKHIAYALSTKQAQTQTKGVFKSGEDDGFAFDKLPTPPSSPPPFKMPTETKQHAEKPAPVVPVVPAEPASAAVDVVVMDVSDVDIAIVDEDIVSIQDDIPVPDELEVNAADDQTLAGDLAGDHDSDKENDGFPTAKEKELAKIRTLSWAELKLLCKRKNMSIRGLNKEQLVKKLESEWSSSTSSVSSSSESDDG